jgi:hypothetical protein
MDTFPLITKHNAQVIFVAEIDSTPNKIITNRNVFYPKYNIHRFHRNMLFILWHYCCSNKICPNSPFSFSVLLYTTWSYTKNAILPNSICCGIYCHQWDVHCTLSGTRRRSGILHILAKWCLFVLRNGQYWIEYTVRLIGYKSSKIDKNTSNNCCNCLHH